MNRITTCANSGMPVDDMSMRHTMGAFPSGITVLTTRVDEKPIGLTISSFTSVSMDPPLILQCVARTARSLPAFVPGRRVVVNILAHDQASVARLFASKVDDRFAGIEFGTDEHGSPVLAGTAAWVSGGIERVEDAGDHVIVLTSVDTVHRSKQAPLLYHSGRMHTWPEALAG